jgi:hypothetical protein
VGKDLHAGSESINQEDSTVTFNPMEWDFHTWRLIFLITAGWTLLIALPGLFAPTVGLRSFFGNDSLRFRPRLRQWLLNFYLFLLALGLLLVAWQLPSFVWIVAIAAATNAALSITLLVYHFRGRNSDLMATVALFEIIFTFLFVMYLIGGARAP